MRIVAVAGHVQYGASTAFLDGFASGARALGHDVVRTTIREVGEHPPDGADLFFSMGGIGLGVGWPAPFLSWLLDHPVWYPNLVHLVPERDGLIVVAGEHVAEVNDFLGFAVPTGFVPHGITVDPALGMPSFADDERDIDVLFAGSFEPKQRPAWSSDDARVHAVMQTTLALANDRWDHHMRVLDVADLFVEALATHGFTPTPDINRRAAAVLAWLDSRIRDRRRLACVQSLDEAGVAVHLVGNGWERAHGLQHAVVMKPVDHHELLALARRAKVVLNTGPPLFNQGWHERVPLAMASGALAVSETNDWVTNAPQLTRVIDTYEMKDYLDLGDRTRAALADPARGERTREAFGIVCAHHTWEHRAATVLAMVEL
jgi:hypothetical protein